MILPKAQEPERKPRVLIVEDSLDLSALWQRLFSAKGYAPVVANDARTACHIFGADSEFDVVVSDYFLPDMNGLALLERLRETSSTIPFVLVTGSRETAIQERALSFDATAFLNKPIKFMFLEEEIRRLLAKCAAENTAAG